MTSTNRPQPPAAFSLSGGAAPRKPWATSAERARRAGLAARAGRAEPVTADFEQLEPRQLMFAIAIGGYDGTESTPGTYTVANTATFGYTVPLLVGLTPDASSSPPTPVVENFDQIDATQFPPAGLNGVLVPSPIDLQDSRIRIEHNIDTGVGTFPTAQGLAGGLRVPRIDLYQVTPAGGGAPTGTDRELRVRLAATQSITFVFPSAVLQASIQTELRDAENASGTRVAHPDVWGLVNPATSAPAQGQWSPTPGPAVDRGFDLRYEDANGTRVRLLLGTQLVAEYRPDNAQTGTSRQYSRSLIFNPTNTSEPIATQYSFSSVTGAAFDRIVIDRIGSGAAVGVDDIIIDEVTGVPPPGRFADFVTSRITGAQVDFAGTMQPFTTNANAPTSPITSGLSQDFSAVPAGAVATGTLFTGSQIQLNHSGLTTSPTVSGGALTINVNNAGSASIAFRTTRNEFRPVVTASFSLPVAGAGSLDALTAGGVVIEALREGQVLDNATNIVITPTTVVGGQQFYEFHVDMVVFGATAGRAAFDSIRFRRSEPITPVPADTQVRIDNITGYAPTLVEILDLYGRPLVASTALGVPLNSVLANVDANDDGVPDYNDGIGRVLISNSTSDTNLTIIGGSIGTADDGFPFTPAGPDGNFDDLESRGFGYDIDRTQTTLDPTSAPARRGLPPTGGSVIIGAPYTRNNASGADYIGDAPGTVTTYPQVRPINNPSGGLLNLEIGGDPDPAPGIPRTSVGVPNLSILNFSNQPLEDNFDDGAAPGAIPGTFVRFQGVFTLQGESVGVINIAGAIHGQSNVGGAARRVSLGYLVGSFNASGDVGQLFLASDAGMFWTRDTTTPVGDIVNQSVGPVVTTGSRIDLGRTLGQIFIAGRNYASINVLGDVSNPARSILDYSRYSEVEKTYRSTPPAQQDAGEYWSRLTALQNSTPFISFDFQNVTQNQGGGATDDGVLTGGQAVAFGAGGLRNETIAGAEYVGGSSGAVTIDGELLGSRPIPDGAEDGIDVYALSGAKGRTITINATGVGNRAETFNVRIVDRNGRTLATHQSPAVSSNRLPLGQVAVQLTYTPDSTDVYYIVVSSAITGNVGALLSYRLGVTGMVSSTAGMISVGLNSPGDISINGGLGLLRAGNGVVAPDGTDSLPSGTLVQTLENARTVTSQRDLSISILGDATALVFGSSLLTRTNITSNLITVGGNLGVLVSGAAQAIVGSELAVGDIGTMTLVVGGSVGTIQVARALGWLERQYNNDQTPPGTAGPVSITTGAAGGRGDIGSLLVGTLVAGDVTTIRSSAGSTFDRLVIGTVVGGPGSGFIVGSAIDIDLGFGSDLRFVDFNGIVRQVGQTQPILESSIPVPYNTGVIVTDDSGARVSITVNGGVNARASSARLIILPLNNGGAAVARLEANLLNAGNLVVSALDSTGSVAIGRVVVNSNNGSSTRRSSVTFNGGTEVDVLNLQVTGLGLDQLRNDSPEGDIVAADVSAVNRVSITGNLGRTEVGELSSPLLGPFLGLATGNGGDVGTPLLVDDNALSYDLSLVYYPFTSSINPESSADDLGAPFDPYLNGLVVRTGNVLSVQSNKSIGDVILTGAGARIDSVTAAADGNVAQGDFEGIVGSVYAADIGSVDVGSGLKSNGNSALADAGIFAVNAIQAVNGGRIRGAVISGPIVAANLGATPRGRQAGVGSVSLSNGLYDNAFIGSATLDSFWISARLFTGYNVNAQPELGSFDAPVALGPVGSVTGDNSPLFRSTILGRTVGSLNFGNTYFDASRVEARGVANNVNSGTIGSISAKEVRNSTVGGEPVEFRQNLIVGSGRFSSINVSGDISDLVIDSVTQVDSINARNITRLNVNGVGRIGGLNASGDLRSSTIVGSIIDALRVTGDIRASSITAANSLSVSAGGAIGTTRIAVSGVGGTLTQVQSGGDLNADILSAGSLGTIRAGGDFTGSITTTNATIGDLNTLNAGGSILASIDVRRNIGTLQAGRDIGRRLDGLNTTRSRVEITGTLGTIQAGGQIYSDVRVGQTIGRVQMGRVASSANRPGDPIGTQRDLVSDAYIVAAGRIENVSVTGDLGVAIRADSGGIGAVSITDGSLRQSARVANTIEVGGGDLGSLTISNGQLGGNVAVPFGSINSISVTASGNSSRFGSIGYEQGLSPVSTGNLDRGDVPPRPAVNPNGVRDGVVISAGLDISNVQVARGIYESVLQAGRRIGTVTVGTQVGVNSGIATGDVTFAARRPVIAAGDEITSVTINGQNLPAGTVGARGLFLHAGLLSLGADNAPGGTGANADTVKSGRATTVAIRGSVVNTQVLAGIDAGADGIYTGAGDDAVAPGLSSIRTATIANGPLASSGSLVAADTQPTGTFPVGVTVAGGLLPVAGGLAFTGSTAGFLPINGTGLIITSMGDPFRAKFTGPGQAFWDDFGGRIVLVGTTSAQSALTLERTGGAVPQVSGLQIVSTDDAGLRSLTTTGVWLTDTFGTYIDGDVGVASLDLVTTAPSLSESAAGEPTKTFRVGETLNQLNTSNTALLSEPTTVLVRANRIDRTSLSNRFGDNRASRIDARSIGELAGGRLLGIVSVDQVITTVNFGGEVSGRIRAGYDINSVTVGSLAPGARVSAGRNIGSVTVRGDVTDAAILAGADLGTDGTFDRYDTATGQRPASIQDIPNLAGFEDRVGAGNLGGVNIQGSLVRSDLLAGLSRGNSGFITGTDRLTGQGRSNIGTVRVTGSAGGSTNNAQGFGILSTGTLAGATANGQALTPTSTGGFQVQAITQQPRSLRVESLVVAQPSTGVYTATLTFNLALQPGANSGDLLRAIQITQVRNDGSVVALQGGLNFGPGADNTANTSDDIDYIVRHDAATNSIVITFATALTNRDLLRSSGSYGRENPNLPGPGLFRITVLGGTQANALRSATGSTLDGGGDGFSSTTAADNYVEFAQIGDAGDRLVPTVARASGQTIDYYGPTNLDTIMGATTNLDGMPTANRDYTVRGLVGDHPDRSTVLPQAADIDLYTISLRAGQILRLGNIGGSALLATRTITTAAGEIVASSFLSASASNSGIPNPRFVSVANENVLQLIASSDPFDQSETYLVRFTGTYVIGIGAIAGSNNALTSPAVTSAPGGSPAGLVGDYNFTVRVTDDGDSGFYASSLVPLDAGQLVNNEIPVSTSFDDPSVAGTAAELAFVRVTDPNSSPVDNFDDTRPGFIFTLNLGPDGAFNTADDVITGTNGRGIRIVRQGNVLGSPVTRSRDVSAGVTVGTQATNTGFAASVPLASAFPTEGTVVTVNATQATYARYNFQRLPGPDGVFGNNDDLVTPTSVLLSIDGVFGNGNDVTLTDPGALGINFVRQAAPGSAFNVATDVVRTTSNSGDGVRQTQNAPLPSEFAGPDNRLGTADDVRSIARGEYTYTLLGATSGARPVGNGTGAARSGDRVEGVNRYGSKVTRTAGADGIFGTVDDATTYGQAIGTQGTSGAPTTPVVESDIIHLNSGQPIAVGTRYRVTLKLARGGGNIGLLQPVLERNGSNVFIRVADARGLVQFGIFETTQSLTSGRANGTNIDDALNVASTNNVVGYAGNELRTGQRIANSATGNAYGYDANGDFYFEYSTPASQVVFDPANPTNPVNQPGTFAVYVQGAVRSDYQVEVAQIGAFTPPRNTPATRTQNVLISTAGGSINWLEANPYTPTRIAGFDPSFNGFAGDFNGEDALAFMIDSPLNVDSAGNQQNLVARLQRVFDQALGVGRVRISANPSEFLGQAYSTVYLTSSSAPPAFSSTIATLGTFGQAQLVDPFNANTRDEAVVFTNDLSVLGIEPTQAGAGQFVSALTAAVGRRVGELLGVRMTEPTEQLALKTPQGGSPSALISTDIMSWVSVEIAPLVTSDVVFDFFGGVSPTNVNPAGLPAGQQLNQPLFSTPVVQLARQQATLFTGLAFNLTIPNQTTQFLLGNQATVSLLNRVIFRP